MKKLKKIDLSNLEKGNLEYPLICERFVWKGFFVTAKKGYEFSMEDTILYLDENGITFLYISKREEVILKCLEWDDKAENGDDEPTSNVSVATYIRLFEKIKEEGSKKLLSGIKKIWLDGYLTEELSNFALSTGYSNFIIDNDGYKIPITQYIEDNANEVCALGDV